MKKTAAFILSAALTLSMGVTDILAADAGMFNFQRVNFYQDGQFTDVAPTAWYSTDAGIVYELGLMQGVSQDCFDPSGTVTTAQTIAIAARLHSIYNTGSGEFEADGPWYKPYVDYGKEYGIITGEPELSAAATRAQFVDILSRAMPEDSLEAINRVDENAIPDVKSRDEFSESIYRFYRAGILTGSGSRSAFYPGSSISRAEAAAVIVRMADKDRRRSFTLQYSGPDLTAQEKKDDSFFEDSAILGNSLVEGLRLFSKLKSIDYYSATSVSVVSATKTKNVKLKDGTKGTLVQSLCQKQYDKIYIELGINEIGGNVETFIQRYGGMIDSIREAEPNADIYILSVLPVTKNKSNSGTVFNMKRVKMYNEALYKLAEEKQCYYMDVCSAFQGSDGYLPSSWSSDGVHLYGKYYSVWENCMRTLYR